MYAVFYDAEVMTSYENEKPVNNVCRDWCPSPVKLEIDLEFQTTQNGHAEKLYSPRSLRSTNAIRSVLTSALDAEISELFFLIFAYSAEGNLDFLAFVLQKIQNMQDRFQIFYVQKRR